MCQKTGCQTHINLDFSKAIEKLRRRGYSLLQEAKAGATVQSCKWRGAVDCYSCAEHLMREPGIRSALMEATKNVACSEACLDV